MGGGVNLSLHMLGNVSRFCNRVLLFQKLFFFETLSACQRVWIPGSASFAENETMVSHFRTSAN